MLPGAVRSMVYAKFKDYTTFAGFLGLNKPTLCLLGLYAATNLEVILNVAPGGGFINSLDPLLREKEAAVEFPGLITVS